MIRTTYVAQRLPRPEPRRFEPQRPNQNGYKRAHTSVQARATSCRCRLSMHKSVLFLPIHPRTWCRIPPRSQSQTKAAAPNDLTRLRRNGRPRERSRCPQGFARRRCGNLRLRKPLGVSLCETQTIMMRSVGQCGRRHHGAVGTAPRDRRRLRRHGAP